MKKKNNQALVSMDELVCGAKEASQIMAQLSSEMKNQLLKDAAREILQEKTWILEQNRKDVRAAIRSGLEAALVDRLTLDSKRIHAMAEGIRMIVEIEDPIWKVQAQWIRPNGLRISKVTVPLGVILIIYESRPNVTVDCAALALKSGNSVILRGGSESFYSNRALAAIFERVLKKRRLPPAAVSLVKTTDRRMVDALLKKEGDISLVIPRGGTSLIRKVVRSSRIPVIKHYQGICHVYVDASADLKKAAEIVFNAKMQRPGVCNAMETLLVHRKIAAQFLPVMGERLMSGGCEIRAETVARKFLPGAKLAKPSDFGHEFLDRILAVKVVSDVVEAIRHIRQYSSAHTEAIVTEDGKAAERFKQEVDSASVMVNASTRFADGYEYGLGAEIGISTDKIHARGPMGLEGLTSYKYLVEGNGQIRS